MANTFLEALHSGRVLLMDGAMGTELQRAGIQPGECYEHWNLTHPERVLAIHRANVEAGAEVLLTNTFQANPPALAKHGLDRQLPQLCKAGIALAREAAGTKCFALGDMTVLDPLHPTDWLTSLLRSMIVATPLPRFTQYRDVGITRKRVRRRRASGVCQPAPCARSQLSTSARLGLTAALP